MFLILFTIFSLRTYLLPHLHTPSPRSFLNTRPPLSASQFPPVSPNIHPFWILNPHSQSHTILHFPSSLTIPIFLIPHSLSLGCAHLATHTIFLPLFAHIIFISPHLFQITHSSVATNFTQSLKPQPRKPSLHYSLPFYYNSHLTTVRIRLSSPNCLSHLLHAPLTILTYTHPRPSPLPSHPSPLPPYPPSLTPLFNRTSLWLP